jgi:hypothetical protein
MEQANTVVCICETHEQAQRAMYNLQVEGIDLGTLSVASKDNYSDLHDLDYYSVGEETFAIPGLGSLLVSGPLASWIVTAFDNEEGGNGATILGAALATRGIPHDSVLEYEAALRADKHVLVVHGSPNAVAAALKVIGGTTHCSHTIHGEKVFETVHGSSLLATAAYTHEA